MNLFCKGCGQSIAIVCKSQDCNQYPFGCNNINCENEIFATVHTHKQKLDTFSWNEFKIQIDQLIDIQNDKINTQVHKYFCVFTKKVEIIKDRIDKIVNDYQKQLFDRTKYQLSKESVYLVSKYTSDVKSIKGKQIHNIQQPSQKFSNFSEVQSLLSRFQPPFQKLICQLEDILNKAVTLEKVNVSKTLNEEGILFQSNGKWNEAIIKFQQAIKNNPYYGSSYFLIGWCYYNLNQFQQAQKWTKQSLKYIPLQAKSYNILGNILFNSQKFDSCIDYYNQAIRLNPKQDNFYLNRAQSYEKIGKYKEALSDFEKAYSLNPLSQYLSRQKRLKQRLRDIKNIDI